MTGITFENIPGSGLVAPGFFFELTSGGQYTSQSRALLIGHKAASGTMNENEPVAVGSELDAYTLAGAKSMLGDMFRLARRNLPVQTIHIAATPEVGTARVRTITVNGPFASAGVGVLEIAGEKIQIEIDAGATVNTVAADLAAAIENYYNPLNNAYLPVSASANLAVVTLTAIHKGVVAGECDVYVPTLTTTNLFTGAAITVAETTAAAGDPDLSAVLAGLNDDPYDYIIVPFSDDTNLGRITDFLSDVSGRWSYNRMIYGHAFTVKTDTHAGLVTHGLAKNDRHTSTVMRYSDSGDYHPSWQWVTALAASSMAWLMDGETGKCSVNQTGKIAYGLRAPRDRSKYPNYAAKNELNQSGISTWRVLQDGSVAIDKIVTGYLTNPLGQADETFRDVQAMAQSMHALRYWAERVSAEHGQKAISDTNPGNLGSLSTPIDIENTFIQAAYTLAQNGILENPEGFAKAIVVSRASGSPNRVNVYSPWDRVNPLDVMATNARLFSQYREAAVL